MKMKRRNNTSIFSTEKGTPVTTMKTRDIIKGKQIQMADSTNMAQSSLARDTQDSFLVHQQHQVQYLRAYMMPATFYRQH